MNDKVCSGCGACENICPKKCIRIDKVNKKRFLQIIDRTRCIKCDLCEKVCPHNNVNLYDSIEAYNGFSNTPSVIERSSSGGIATEIYKYCLQQGILCVGVALTNSGKIEYKFLSNEKDIRLAAGSKYAYSYMNDMYESICSILYEDKQEIVFIGLPCHAYALRKYCEIRGVKTKKLTICDIVCHGIVMPYFYTKHINKICDKVDKIFFRKKDNPYGLVVYSNGREVYSKNRNEDEYMLMFQDFILAESCRTCIFSNRKRAGDITIKDCSSPIEKRLLKEPMNQSSILINTYQGQRLWQKVNNINISSYKYPIEDICNEDIRLQGKHMKCKKENLFWILESLLGYKITARMLLKKRDLHKLYISRRDS